jgi:tetratricopeptide (TPR) repeat protein
MNPYMQASALAEIAGAQAGRGDRNAAVMTVRKAAQSASLVQEIYAKGPALLAIAEAQAKLGDRLAAAKTFRQARQTVRVSGDERYKAEALGELAVAQSRAGDFPGAVDTADGVQDGYAQAGIWRRIAAAQGANGNAERALAWVAKQGSFIKKAYALLGVAEGLASPDQ